MDLGFLLSVGPMLLRGLLITLELTCLGMLVGLLLGIPVGVLRLSKRPFLRLIAGVYVEVFRGLPILVVLVFIYYGLGSIWSIDRYAGAVAGFGLCYGSYIAETIRAGIESIDPGQVEAARVLGFSRLATLRYVTLPQATRNVLPALANEGVALLKDTSLASVLAIEELTQMGNLIRARTYRSFDVLAMVAMVYLLCTLLLSGGARKLEAHLRRGRRGTRY